MVSDVYWLDDSIDVGKMPLVVCAKFQLCISVYTNSVYRNEQCI